MGGIELTNSTLVVDREPNQLDELAIGFSAVLAEFDISHAYVAGYVSILAGRARSTEAVDVLIEDADEQKINTLVSALEERDYWGPAMPLSSMFDSLQNGDNIWVAPDEQLTPHLEVKFARDEFDRASIRNGITAEIDATQIPIGPLELQIAYKLSLGARTDIEDAVHLYTLFEADLRETTLEKWVHKLDVEDAYEQLKQA